jgi:hypothetical protein
MGLFKGFSSIFSWLDCFNSQSPQERVDQILDDFYSQYPWIERSDQKALEKDFKSIFERQDGSCQTNLGQNKN